MKFTCTKPSPVFLFLIPLLWSLSCREPEAETELSRWEATASRVEILRDSFGVPHIYAPTDADAVFGLLYAQCEDDYPRVERNYLWAIGRLAEVEGESQLYSDLRARLFMTEDEARECYRKSPVWLKKLCDAFADGVNYYLHTHPGEPRHLERYENWMPFYFFEGSIGGNIEGVSLSGIRGFYEGLESSTDVEQGGEGPESFAEPPGSNGIAIAPSRTASGKAMLLINPHTSFFFRPEVHVVSGEGMNVYGAVTWGQFFVYQGFNEKTGWMHTSGYTDVMDEFVEDIQQRAGQLMYRQGTQWRPVHLDTVRLRYMGPDSALSEVEFPIYRTHHGPVTALHEGRWTTTALMWDPVEALKQSVLRTRTDSLAAFHEVMKIRRNSSNNTVFADAQGNIAYYHGNFIPRRNPAFDYTRPVDGADPAADWQGLHEVDESIVIVNPGSGWLQNCNSTPYTAAGAYSPPPGDYPVYFAPEPENTRGIHAIALLEEAESLDLDGLIRLAYDTHLPTFDILLPRLLQAGERVSDPDMQRAIALLRDWDRRTSAESRAMTLAHYYGQQILKAPRPESVRGWLNVFRYWGETAPESDCLKALRGAMDRLTADFGSWSLPWGEVNRYQRLDGDMRQAFNDSLPSVPMPHTTGIWGYLAAYGVNYDNGTRRIYGTRGNSFVAVVEFGERVRARSLLAGGQSGRPDSPHFDDQVERYAQGRFKEVLFYREDVEAGSGPAYRPGQPMRLFAKD